MSNILTNLSSNINAYHFDGGVLVEFDGDQLHIHFNTDHVLVVHKERSKVVKLSNDCIDYILEKTTGSSHRLNQHLGRSQLNSYIRNSDDRMVDLSEINNAEIHKVDYCGDSEKQLDCRVYFSESYDLMKLSMDLIVDEMAYFQGMEQLSLSDRLPQTDHQVDHQSFISTVWDMARNSTHGDHLEIAPVNMRRPPRNRVVETSYAHLSGAWGARSR